MTAPTLADDYRVCEEITREQARNFSWGIRLLPAPKRSALSAVYALARRIDDIGDGDLPDDRKLALLAETREDLAKLSARSDDAVLRALADASERLPIPIDAFNELIDGCEMDVRGTSYRTIDDLVDYCRCVAGSIGRLSLGVFAPSGVDLALASDLADTLGIALQLTNILRDIREDLHHGRVYLPLDDLELFRVKLVTRSDGTLDPHDGAVAELIRFEAARAWGRYDRGLELLPMLDRRSAACCAAMAGIYLELLQRMAADPRPVLRERMSLSTGEKLRVAAGALAKAAIGRV